MKQQQKLILIHILRTNNQQKNYKSYLLENLKRRKVYSSFKFKIWRADLADIKLTSKYKK